MDYRNYIYRLAESMSGQKLILYRHGSHEWYEAVSPYYLDEAACARLRQTDAFTKWEEQCRQGVKTPAGWRYDA